MLHVFAWCQWGAILSTGVLVTPTELQREYLCDACEGGVVVKTVVGEDGQIYYHAQCADCGGTTFVSKWLCERQQADWYRITMYLPPDLRALVDQKWKKPDAPKLSFGEAASSLYGTGD